MLKYWKHPQVRIAGFALVALLLGRFTLGELIQTPIEAPRPLALSGTAEPARLQLPPLPGIPRASKSTAVHSIGPWRSIQLVSNEDEVGSQDEDAWTAHKGKAKVTFPKDEPLLSPFGPDFDAPEELLIPDDAMPLSSARKVSPEELDDFMDTAVPDFNKTERDVWQKELHGVSPDDAMNILELRRRLGSTIDDSFRTAEEDFGPALPVPQPEPQLHLHNVSLPETGDSHFWVNSSVAALEQAIDTHLHNIANASTDGFLRREPVLKSVTLRKQFNSAAGPMPTYGVENAGTWIDSNPGPHRETGRSLDFAVEGQGFMTLTNIDGDLRVCRGGSFQLDEDGVICLIDDGVKFTLEPEIAVPDGAVKIDVDSTGIVTCQIWGADESVTLGQIEIARFIDSTQLMSDGPLLYEQTIASGKPIVGAPGQIGFGKIVSGVLEQSNVDIEAELVAIERLRKQRDVLRSFTVGVAIVSSDGPVLPRAATNVPLDEQPLTR
ncbi:flagellar hook-basal body protein [Calycomorphotria hydatis]|uniref:Flagellar basal-body rod protein FlgG n=1 Tax=Calycomorphotria hydatis TaxID=2528027 RepID=A0A517T4X2_9PLAN|nr:flagellar hook basal-body protein [Calycomorphotria hydatis]QDT63414.1 Flagellar basal-body rod protein FlgG [Calycomorphotria hydatis]